jgi:hypothetical protein
MLCVLMRTDEARAEEPHPRRRLVVRLALFGSIVGLAWWFGSSAASAAGAAATAGAASADGRASAAAASGLTGPVDAVAPETTAVAELVTSGLDQVAGPMVAPSAGAAGPTADPAPTGPEDSVGARPARFARVAGPVDATAAAADPVAGGLTASGVTPVATSLAEPISTTARAVVGRMLDAARPMAPLLEPTTAGSVSPVALDVAGWPASLGSAQVPAPVAAGALDAAAVGPADPAEKVDPGLVGVPSVAGAGSDRGLRATAPRRWSGATALDRAESAAAGASPSPSAPEPPVPRDKGGSGAPWSPGSSAPSRYGGESSERIPRALVSVAAATPAATPGEAASLRSTGAGASANAGSRPGFTPD